jgi:hypothetical protein
MANIITTIQLKHNKEVIQTIKDRVLRPVSKTKEEAVALMGFFNSLAGAERDAQLTVQVDSGDAVFAHATLTIASGAANDTGVVSGTTFTCVDHRETNNFTAAADSSGSLNNLYITFQDQPGLNKYAVWFNINSAGTAPVVAGVPAGNMIMVSGATNVTAATLATAITTACNALPGSNPRGVIVTNGASTHVIFTSLLAGVTVQATIGSASTFSVSRTVTGSAVTSVQYNVAATDTLTAANLAAAINANSAMNQVATATSAAAIVTVSSWFPGPVGNYITLTATTGVTASGSVLASGAISTTYSTKNVYHFGV